MSMKIEPYPISDDAELKNTISAGDRLIIIDVHSEWCGPCLSMLGTYENCVMTFDDFNDRCQIYYANADKIESLKEYARTSQPRFIFYKDGEKIGEVLGANAPVILDLIKNNLPAKAEEDDA